MLKAHRKINLNATGYNFSCNVCTTENYGHKFDPGSGTLPVLYCVSRYECI